MPRLEVTSEGEPVHTFDNVTIEYDSETKIAQALQNDVVVAQLGVSWHQGDDYRGTRLYGTQRFEWAITDSKLAKKASS